MNKKQTVIMLLKEGKWTASEIAKRANCYETYVSKISKEVAIDPARAKRKVGLAERRHAYSPNKTLREIAEELGITYAAAHGYAVNNALPYKVKQVQEKGRELTPEEHEAVKGLLFMSSPSLHKHLFEVDSGVSLDKVKRVKATYGRSYDYANNETLHHLSLFGAEDTATKYQIEAEVLHNIMYIFENGTCPYTDKPLRLRSGIEYHLEKWL